MILVAVGTQLPFDRLVRLVDDWARATNISDVVAQVGPSTYVPHTLKAFPFMDPEQFRNLQAEAKLIISHAGMGSILTAMEYGKPIIIMPRDHELGEHRNSHQMATARRFQDRAGVHVAADEAALLTHLQRLSELRGVPEMSAKAPDAFTDRLRAFIATDDAYSRRSSLHLLPAGLKA